MLPLWEDVGAEPVFRSNQSLLILPEELLIYLDLFGSYLDFFIFYFFIFISLKDLDNGLFLWKDVVMDMYDVIEHKNEVHAIS